MRINKIYPIRLNYNTFCNSNKGARSIYNTRVINHIVKSCHPILLPLSGNTTPFINSDTNM